MGSGSHAGAPVMMAVLGNSTTAVRLRGGARAPDVGNTLNLRVNFD